MTWTAPDVARRPEPGVADERDMLESWLEYHRETLLWKCSGLTSEQLRSRSVEPSSLSLLGLVRHMAEVERWWFRRNIAGEELSDIYCTDDSPDGDFDDLDDADADADFATLAAEVVAARASVAGRPLDETFRHGNQGNELSVRWVFVHMVEEYARHNGHADLIRERIDGATGD